MKKIEIQKNSRYVSGPRRLQKTAEYKYVYLEKRNNFIRDVLKKLFFTFLVLLFSKKHKFYKRKVKNFILHLRVKIFGTNMPLPRLIFVTLNKFYLRVRYIKFYRISSVQNFYIVIH